MVWAAWQDDPIVEPVWKNTPVVDESLREEEFERDLKAREQRLSALIRETQEEQARNEEEAWIRRRYALAVLLACAIGVLVSRVRARTRSQKSVVRPVSAPALSMLNPAPVLPVPTVRTLHLKHKGGIVVLSLAAVVVVAIILFATRYTVESVYWQSGSSSRKTLVRVDRWTGKAVEITVAPAK